MAARSSSHDIEVLDPRNEVRLRGRVSGTPDARVLPSGDTVVLLRLVVPRTERSKPKNPTRHLDSGGADGRSAKPGVDTLECAIWRGDLRRRVSTWTDGDQVEIEGALHRRFWRAGAGVASRYEVEASAVRRLARAGR